MECCAEDGLPCAELPDATPFGPAALIPFPEPGPH